MLNRVYLPLIFLLATINPSYGAHSEPIQEFSHAESSREQQAIDNIDNLTDAESIRAMGISKEIYLRILSHVEKSKTRRGRTNKAHVSTIIRASLERAYRGQYDAQYYHEKYGIKIIKLNMHANNVSELITAYFELNFANLISSFPAYESALRKIYKALANRVKASTTTINSLDKKSYLMERPVESNVPLVRPLEANQGPWKNHQANVGMSLPPVVIPEQLPSNDERASLGQKVYKISNRYLEGTPPPSIPYAPQHGPVNHNWLKNPSLTLSPIISIARKSLLISSKNFDLDGLNATIYSNIDPKYDGRVTFVFPGRGLGARIPVEDVSQGRVILVVTEQERDAHLEYLNEFSDLLVVHTLKSYGMGIDKNNLGMISARRLAAFYFAYHLRLKDFIMLDDNLENFYLAQSRNQGWGGVYNYLATLAIKNGLVLVSARTYSPEHDKEGVSSRKQDVFDAYGSKIFYCAASKLFEKSSLQGIGELIPPFMDVWGEDLWMQLMLKQKGYKTGIASRGSLLYTRAKSAKRGACASIIKKANHWLSEEIVQDWMWPNGETASVYEQIKKIVKQNFDRRESEAKAASALDLAKITKKRTLSAGLFSGKNDYAEHKIEKKRNPKKPRLSGEDAFSPKKEGGHSSASIHPREALLAQMRSVLPNLLGKNLLLKHQEEGISALADALSLGVESGYFNMATGSGKTTVFLAMVAIAMESKSFADRNIAITAPTVELVGQIYRDIEKFNKRFSEILNIDLNKVIKVSAHDMNQGLVKINDDISRGGKLLIVCRPSMENLLSRGGWHAMRLGLLIVDEMHLYASANLITWKTNSASDHTLLFGFSATPPTPQALGKEAIYSYSPLKGIKDGILCPFVIESFGVDYSRENVEALILALPEFLKSTVHPHSGYLSEKKGVIWVPSVVLAQSLAKHLKTSGIRAAAIHSYDNSAKKHVENFTQSNEAQVLVAVDMLKVGFDAKIDFEIIAKKIVNRQEWIQISGRALRGGAFFDAKEDAEPDVIRAPAGKIAYILVFDDGIPEGCRTNPFLYHRELALSTDYLAGHEWLVAQKYQLKPFGKTASKACVRQEPMMTDDDHDLHQAHMNSIRSINNILMPNGKRIEVRVRPTLQNGDSAFLALDMERNEFIERVLATKPGDTRFDNLLSAAYESLRLKGNNEESWAAEYARITDSGDAVHWPNDAHLRLLSRLYNYRIHLYTIDPEKGDSFMPLLDEDGIIYEGRDRFSARDFHLTWVSASPRAPLTHFERLLMPSEIAQEDLLYEACGLANLHADDDELSELFLPGSDAFNHVLDVINDANMASD